jgi:hypothetical protein
VHLDQLQSKLATVFIPISRADRITRKAISPLLATRIFCIGNKCNGICVKKKCHFKGSAETAKVFMFTGVNIVNKKQLGNNQRLKNTATDKIAPPHFSFINLKHLLPLLVLHNNLEVANNLWRPSMAACW